MRFRICLSIAFFSHICCTCMLFGQQSYSSDDYGEPGTVHLYSRHLAGFTNEEILASGEDVTWDVSSLNFVPPNPAQIITRDQAIDGFTFSTLCALGGINIFDCLNIFNNTQQAWLQQDTQLFDSVPDFRSAALPAENKYLSPRDIFRIHGRSERNPDQCGHRISAAGYHFAISADV